MLDAVSDLQRVVLVVKRREPMTEVLVRTKVREMRARDSDFP